MSPLCGGNAPPILFCLAKRECAVHGGREKHPRGLWDAYGPNAPQKRELNSPEVWKVSVACAARRASARCCGSQQPSDGLRLTGLYQLLAAAEWQLKERQAPKEAVQAGRAAMGAVFGAGAAHRTPLLRAHRPSGRERSEALARPRVLRTKTQIKNISFPPAAAHFLFQRKWGAAFRGAKRHYCAGKSAGIPAVMHRAPTVGRKKLPPSGGQREPYLCVYFFSLALSQ